MVWRHLRAERQECGEKNASKVPAPPIEATERQTGDLVEIEKIGANESPH